MKPLTANDLVVGDKYVVTLYSTSEVCEFRGVKKDEYFFKGYPFSFNLNESDIPSQVTPYISINQTKQQ
jgi:hypothetical protein